MDVGQASNVMHPLILTCDCPGYFSLNHTAMGAPQDLFGQWWKEYAHSDSRYLTSDAFVLCMETVTAVSAASVTGPVVVWSLY